MRPALGVLASSLVLALGASAAPAGSATVQGPLSAGGPSGAVDPGQVADPDAAVTGTEPSGPDVPPPDLSDGTGPTDPSGPDPPADDPAPEEPGDGGTIETPADAAPARVLDRRGYGDAADQSQAAKQEELRAVCASPSQPTTSRMLGLAGSVGGDDDADWGWVVLAIAAGALGVAAIAFLGRRRPGGEPARPRGPLESAATVVAILGGIAGLAVQFVPGIGVQEAPAPEATMTVREVHPRITRGEYLRRTGGEVDELSRVDRREVGNVIWLEIELAGYRERRPTLQIGLHDPDAGEVLLPGSVKPVRLGRVEQDVLTRFEPIWVGYPRSRRFVVQFRLLDGGHVQELAKTGRMRSSRFRYRCPRRS